MFAAYLFAGAPPHQPDLVQRGLALFAPLTAGINRMIPRLCQEAGSNMDKVDWVVIFSFFLSCVVPLYAFGWTGFFNLLLPPWAKVFHTAGMFYNGHRTPQVWAMLALGLAHLAPAFAFGLGAWPAWVDGGYQSTRSWTGFVRDVANGVFTALAQVAWPLVVGLGLVAAAFVALRIGGGRGTTARSEQPLLEALARLEALATKFLARLEALEARERAGAASPPSHPEGPCRGLW